MRNDSEKIFSPLFDRCFIPFFYGLQKLRIIISCFFFMDSENLFMLRAIFGCRLLLMPFLQDCKNCKLTSFLWSPKTIIPPLVQSQCKCQVLTNFTSLNLNIPNSLLPCRNLAVIYIYPYRNLTVIYPLIYSLFWAPKTIYLQNESSFIRRFIQSLTSITNSIRVEVF